jgi:hypothetical protein
MASLTALIVNVSAGLYFLTTGRRIIVKNIIACLIVISLSLAACNRVGSEAWCENQKEKPKSDWTMSETGDYTKYCVLGMDSEKWCEKLEKKPKGDWTANEAADYAANCIVGRSE